MYLNPLKDFDMQPNQNPAPDAFNTELSEAMAEGEYANLA
ncbi:hypothetical protein GCM10023185_04070 [Hymenobacter saemangeumensis]|uniref:Uncharacterized protein n=1 Tax=Hymenobacter saemangeumensis TaxID=1084522 RepID=A0ABP8HZS7_9BACT